MEYHCGLYLQQYVNRSDIIATRDPRRDAALVIVESRANYWLPLVIRNALDKIRERNLYVIGSSESLDLVQQHIKGEFVTASISTPNLTIDSYNRLLTSQHFWETFSEENLLLFQPDCLLLRDPSAESLNVDFIGSVCHSLDPDSFIINGGLSHRKKSAMLKACAMMTEADLLEPEDIAFTRLMRREREYCLPTIKQCMNFAIESSGNIDTVTGIHGIDKGYLNDKNILQYLKNNMS